ncbi:MAG: DoxX family protein [Microbacterium sp.]|uniref:DoxX family protein n=1 Tax=Microbacterium sp. TaxID=51671 RepID=UPI003D6FFCFD
MDVLFLIGRVLFALIFIFSGIAVHLVGRKQGVEYARSYGSPLPEIGVPLTGMMAIAGAVMIALGLWADLGALLIVAFLLLITPIMHAFWRETEEQMRQTQTVMFMKNIAMLGGALVILYAYNQLQGEAALSLTDPLFGRAE